MILAAHKKIIVVMPAYNVEKEIRSVFERIPQGLWQKGVEFVVIDDGSIDKTREKIEEIRSYFKGVCVIEKIKNEGYARAQKDGFLEALKMNADIVVLLHSDGQYSPEIMEKLIKPLEDDVVDIVQGSRMLDKKGALRGGMPLYKFVANILLSILENWVYNLNFTEYHSGYMLYSRKALETIPFQNLSDTFHFDGEMLFVGAKMRLRIAEVEIPTIYNNEKSNLRPIRYGFDVINIMVNYLMGRYNL